MKKKEIKKISITSLKVIDKKNMVYGGLQMQEESIRWPTICSIDHDVDKKSDYDICSLIYDGDY